MTKNTLVNFRKIKIAKSLEVILIIIANLIIRVIESTMNWNLILKL